MARVLRRVLFVFLVVWSQISAGNCAKSLKFQLKSVKTIETAEEKLGWIFTAFDEDGGGFMDPDEVAQIVLGLFRLNQ